MLGAAQQQIFNYADDGSGNMVPTSIKPYTPYSNNPQDYVAGFSPMQQQAQSDVANMQTPGQYGQASQAAGAGIMGSFGLAGQEAQTGRNLAAASTNPNVVGAYMNPYIQNALAPAQQLLNQQYGMQSAAQQGAATQQGAFGGSRNALMQGLGEQNRMLAQNQLVGNAYQNAFGQAQNQMNTVSAQGLAGQQAAMQGLGQGIQGAGTLAGIGGQQAGTALNINQAQEAAGAAQQAQQQNVINQQIQNYATAQQYPMMQLANMSGLLRGLPMQSATTQTYQAAPSSVSQLAGLGTAGLGAYKLATMKEGGVAKVKKFDVGGSVKHDLMQMAEADPKAFAEHMKTVQSPEEKKIGYQVAAEMGLTGAAPNIRMAGGGIVAFAQGGDEGAEVDEYEDSPYEDAEDRAFAQRTSYNNALIEQLANTPISHTDKQETFATKTGENKNIRQESRAKGAKDKSFVEKIEHLESRGRDFDKEGKTLTSSKGAVGRMQTMPNTLRDPGFGVKPAQSNHPEELARVGRDYADAMLSRYKDPKLAAMAYNWGPGNVDKYIAGGMKGPVPGETRQYAANFAQGGIASYDGRNGSVVQNDMDQIDTLGSQLDEARTEVEGLSSFGSRQRPMIPDYDARLKSATERKRALESQYEALMNKQGMNKAATGIVPGSMMPPAARKPNPFVQSQSAQPVVAAPTAPVVQPPKDGTPVLPPDQDPKFSLGTPPKASEGSAGKDTQDTTDKEEAKNPWEKMFNDYISKKEAGLTTQKQEDKWMSILSAGLGMMGGTSPYAGVNIGKGGQEGIAAMLSANKQRGAEEAALGKLYSQGYVTKEGALSRAEIAKERGLARGDTNQLNAYNAYQKNVGDVQGRREALFTKEMSSGSNSMLNARLEALNQKLIKDPSDAKAKAEYNSLMQQKEAIRNRIYSSIKEPSPPPGLKLGSGANNANDPLGILNR